MDMNNFYKELYDDQTQKAGKMAALIGYYSSVLKGIEMDWYTKEEIREKIETADKLWGEIYKQNNND